MNTSFKNKTVLITGASAGIGEALAHAFAKEGAHLALLGRRIDRLEKLASGFSQQGIKAFAIAADVTQEKDLPQAVEKIHENGGSPIDVVIANAGFGVMGTIEDLTLEDFRRQFETNVWGVLRTLYATLDDLKKTKGRFVIIGSVLGLVSTPEYGAYAMSKHALSALAASLYAELSPYGISVTLICPGYVKTEFRDINNKGEYVENARPTVPDWIRMPAATAAKLIVKATRYRERERVITMHGKMSVFLNRAFPGFIPRFFRFVMHRKAKALK